MTETMTDPLASSLRERKEAGHPQRDPRSRVAARLRERLRGGHHRGDLCRGRCIATHLLQLLPVQDRGGLRLAETGSVPRCCERFLNSTGNLIADICDLVASGISVPTDYPRCEGAAHPPGLSSASPSGSRMNLRKQPVIETITERVGDRDAAASAFGLVMVAIMAMMRQQGETNPDAIAARLKVEIRSWRP